MLLAPPEPRGTYYANKDASIKILLSSQQQNLILFSLITANKALLLLLLHPIHFKGMCLYMAGAKKKSFER